MLAIGVWIGTNICFVNMEWIFRYILQYLCYGES